MNEEDRPVVMKVVEALRGWKPKRRSARIWSVYCPRAAEEDASRDRGVDEPPPARDWPEPLSERDTVAADSAWRLAVERKPPISSPRDVDGIALCRVVKFEGEVAECSVQIDGYEVPRVGFPAWVLRRKGLEVGGRFHWIMRDSQHVRPGDIDTDVPQSDELSPEEKAELDRLYEEFNRDLAAGGGDWPVYTGDGN
jgi:hypothetical protein